MEVFRLSKAKYAKTLSGRGAAEDGGRWNSPGTELIYTTANRSLALVEVLVHLPNRKMLENYQMLTITLPTDASIETIPESELPSGWDVLPYSDLVQNIGDRFTLVNKHLALIVPSAVTRGDHNYLINPHHTDFHRVGITGRENFSFDRRLKR